MLFGRELAYSTQLLAVVKARALQAYREQMNSEFEYDGFWWLPETPENQVPGKVRFIPSERVALDLQGTLGSKKDDKT